MNRMKREDDGDDSMVSDDDDGADSDGIND